MDKAGEILILSSFIERFMERVPDYDRWTLKGGHLSGLEFFDWLEEMELR